MKTTSKTSKLLKRLFGIPKEHTKRTRKFEMPTPSMKRRKQTVRVVDLLWLEHE